jgi:DNA-binding transcriptional LysR family regulator
MKALQDLDIFVRTVDSGSLSATARALGITPAAASAALKRLEEELQATLLHRSTRSLRVTPEGALFLEHCRLALDTLRDGRQELFTGRSQVRGELRLAVSLELGRNLLLPWLDAFGEQHPQLRFRLQVSEGMAHIDSDPVDAAFAYGLPPDSSRVALSVAPDNRRVLCAAPHYLARRGTPATPQDLGGHDCLCFMRGQHVNDRWSFWQVGQELVVRVRGGHVVNDGDVLRRWAMAGRGVAYRSRLEAADDLRHGNLVALCTDWLTEPAPLYLVLPGGRQLTPALRMLHEFVTRQCERLQTPNGARL